MRLAPRRGRLRGAAAAAVQARQGVLVEGADVESTPDKLQAKRAALEKAREAVKAKRAKIEVSASSDAAAEE